MVYSLYGACPINDLPMTTGWPVTHDLGVVADQHDRNARTEPSLYKLEWVAVPMPRAVDEC
jgi:hypothetical protein